MSLRVRTYERSKRVHVLTACPFCGYEFARNERRHKHLSDHDPEDAGLAPLGEIPADHDAPLFQEVSVRAD